MLKKGMVYRLTLVFIGLVCIPVFLGMISFSVIGRKLILKNSSERITQSMEQIAYSIQKDVKQVSLAASTIVNDELVMELAESLNQERRTGEKYKLTRQLDHSLNTLFSYSNDILSVVFLYRDGTAYEYKGTLYKNVKALREEAWYDHILKEENRGRVHTFISESGVRWDQKNNFLSVAVGLAEDETSSRVEAVYLEFDTGVFDDYLSDETIHTLGNLMIVDENSKVLLSNDYRIYKQNAGDYDFLQQGIGGNHQYKFKIEGENNWVTSYYMQKNKWTIINYIPYDRLISGLDDVIRTVLIFLIVILLSFLSFMLIFINRIVGPVDKMKSCMQRVRKGDLSQRAEVMGEIEIQELAASFNDMIEDIDVLIKQNAQKEKERADYEIEALQSQITPHFLSNTLNTIRLMAMVAKAEAVEKMTYNLMKLLSASFYKGGMMCTFAEELENIEHYLEIMKYRYGDTFTLDKHIDANCEELYVRKLILQPIIENAILHGFSEKQGQGKMAVFAGRKDSCLVVSVTDNGKGMSEERTKEVLSEKEFSHQSFTNVGIANINNRIQLNYGQKYGVQIHSKEGFYTKIILVLPILTTIEEGGR